MKQIFKNQNFIKKCFLIYFLANFNISQSQEKLNNRHNDSIIFDNKIYKKIYQIKLANLPISIELIEKYNSKFSGTVNMNISRRFNNKRENFTAKIELDNLLSKKIIKKLKKLGINQLEKEKEILNYTFLDGDETIFKIFTNSSSIEYSFWELNPNQKHIFQISKNRKKAQKIIDFLDCKLNFKLKYSEIKNKLPKGIYYYINGIVVSKIIID